MVASKTTKWWWWWWWGGGVVCEVAGCMVGLAVGGGGGGGDCSLNCIATSVRHDLQWVDRPPVKVPATPLSPDWVNNVILNWKQPASHSFQLFTRLVHLDWLSTPLPVLTQNLPCRLAPNWKTSVSTRPKFPRRRAPDTKGLLCHRARNSEGLPACHRAWNWRTPE